MLLGMPNCGSTWLAPIIARYSGLSYYDKEFFNPGTNPLHREEIASGFGSERVSTYENIASDPTDALDRILANTWNQYTWDFDKEVYMAWKLPWVTRHFTCFVLDRKPGSLFPPSRGNVLIWYEAIYQSLTHNNLLPPGDTTSKRSVLSKAMAAHAAGRKLLLESGLPIVDMDVFTYGTPTRIARELRDVPVAMNTESVIAEMLATRSSSKKTWREID